MIIKSINCNDLRKRLILYRSKGFHYTVKKISKEFGLVIKLIDMPSSESYSTEGIIYLGTIMDEPYESVLYHELQHIRDFDHNNEDAEYNINPW